MNNCCFTGYLVENPKTSTVNNVVLAEFVVVVYNYRKTKSTERKAEYPHIYIAKLGILAQNYWKDLRQKVLK